MRRAAGIIIIIAIACVYFILVHLYSPTRSKEYIQWKMPTVTAGPTVEIDGTTWTEVMNWSFSDGLYPTGWSWGNWEIVDGYLIGKDPKGIFAVYFFPYTHGGNVLLETKVQFIEGGEKGDVEAHLLTRDTDDLNFESGLVLLADTNIVHLRHMAKKKNYIYDVFPVSGKTNYGDWYVMQFVIHNNQIRAYVNGDRIEGEVAGVPDVLPVGVYHEPHLSVTSGTARFEYVKIYIAVESSNSISNAAGSFFAASACAAPDTVLNQAWQSGSGSTGVVEVDSIPSFRMIYPVRLPEVTPPSAYADPKERHWLVSAMLYMLYFVIFLVCIYIIRHYVFTLNRLFGEQRQPYLDVDTAEWPEVTILIPAHNEDPVMGEILEALLEVDYPREKMTIIPINDRSKDKTAEIVDDFAGRHPDVIKPFHRREGMPGKAAALNDATERVQTEILLVFDADYIPGKGLIKQLVAPFFDPEVGAVMGRVVPHNVGYNLLTRLLDLERSGGYQVDQQARMNLRLVPQYGGTVGGVRKSAILSVGGWRVDSLAEDTDATYRLLVGGWKTIYQNRSECYEHVPETWASRRRQIMRWAEGHNQSTTRFSLRLFFNRRTRFIEKLDGLMLLGVYVMSPILLFGWLLGVILWYLGEMSSSLIIILAVTSYSALGNFAIFFEITAAARLDGSRKRILLLPFLFLGFLVSLISVTRATLLQLLPKTRSDEVLWHKTDHRTKQNRNWRN